MDKGGDVYLASTSTQSDHDVWLIDSGASFHMTPVIARFVGKVKKLESKVETGVTGASPPTVTSMGNSFYLGGQVQGRRP
jgi:predicted Na+-dependent transporter